MLVSVELYISANSAGIAATTQSPLALLAAVTSAQASLPASGTAAGTASNLAGNPAATTGFPGLIIAVVVGCFFIFYLAHRRKP